MPPRRPHEKSRHGCLQCKRRRVKCDEQRPRCTNCAKRQSECEYASEAPIIWANQDLNHSPASSTPTTKNKNKQKDTSTMDTFLFFGRLSKDSSAVPSTFDLNLRDLELMMQWCNSTYRTLSREEATDQIWQAIVPQEALSHPFLMHGILALSALHLARVGSEDRRTTYISSAVGHQNQALAVFREFLGDINSSNGKAMFIFSSMVTVFAFGFPPAPPESTEILALVDDLYQVLVLCSGMVQILETARSWIVDSDLGPLLKVEYDDHHPRYSVPDDARRALQQLHEVNDICAGRDPEHDHSGHKTAVDNIALMLSEIESGLKTQSVAVWWAVKCPKKYLESLRAHRPLALVILAYYGVILHRLRHQWWIDGWSTRILNAVWFSLNNKWRHALNWAMTEVFGPGNF